MCRWPWSHKWTPWGKPLVVEIRWVWQSDTDSPHGQVLLQRRWCETCNKMQQREV